MNAVESFSMRAAFVTSLALLSLVTGCSSSKQFYCLVLFGDSITNSGNTYYPETCPPSVVSSTIAPMCEWSGQLTLEMQVPTNNLGQSGDQSEDMTLKVYKNYTPQRSNNPTTAILIGQNDERICGDTAGCLGNFSTSMMAALTWITVPPGSNKIYAQHASNNGCAADNTVGIGLAMKCESAGNSITIALPTTTNNQPVYVAWLGQDDNSGEATLAIDGITVESLHASSTYGHVIYTNNESTTTVWGRRYVVVSPGTHTIEFTVTSTSGFFEPIWVGTPDYSTVNTLGSPRVFVGDPIYEANGGDVQNTTDFTNTLDDLIAQLYSDGLQVIHVPTHDFVVPSTDMSGADTTTPDGILCIGNAQYVGWYGQHPNNCGFWHIRQAFESRILPAQ
jgi:hypothetical protein